MLILRKPVFVSTCSTILLCEIFDIIFKKIIFTFFLVYAVVKQMPELHSTQHKASFRKWAISVFPLDITA